MATSVRITNGYLRLTAVAADWDLSSSMDGSDTAIGVVKPSQLKALWEQQPGPRLLSIEFKPGATDDELYVKEGSVSGPHICYFRAMTKAGSDTEQIKQFVKYFYGKPTRPFIDYSECDLNTGHEIMFNFE